MKPLEAFLAEIHPEVMQRGKVLINGTEVEFGKPNSSALRRVVREHYATGQSALANFRKWLVRSHGQKQRMADTAAATVWNVLCMTYDAEAGVSNPMALIDASDHTYAYGTKMRIAHALRFWAQYQSDSALYEKLLAWMRHKPDTTPQYVLDALAKTPPYTRTEYRRLLKALEEYKGSPRYPWAWSCLRIVFVCGVPLADIIHLERARVYEALQQGKIILPVGSSSARRTVQVQLVEEELRYLLSFPFSWGIVADIVDPGRTHATHARFSTQPLVKVAAQIFKRAKVEFSRTWSYRLRWSAAWQYYQKTENLVGAGQILGRRDLQVTAEFIQELKKRAEAAKAEKDESLEGSATIEP